MKETTGEKDKKQIQKEVGRLVFSSVVPGRMEGLSSETYRFQPLHCILADVHASRLLHLHMSQILQRERKRGRMRENE